MLSWYVLEEMSREEREGLEHALRQDFRPRDEIDRMVIKDIPLLYKDDEKPIDWEEGGLTYSDVMEDREPRIQDYAMRAQKGESIFD